MYTRNESNGEDIERQERESSAIQIPDTDTHTDTEAKKNKNHYDVCCTTVRPFRRLLYLGPVAVATMEAADVGKSLWTSHTTSVGVIIIGAVTAFLSSFGLTGEATNNNIDETCEIIKKRRFPHDWPTLSGKKEALSIGLAVLPAAWGPFAEAAQAYYFVDAVPFEYKFIDKTNKLVWSLFSGGIGLGAGFTTLLTESMEVYKFIRKRIAGVSESYQNIFSQYVSPTLGGVFGVLKALQDSIQCYIAIKSIFNITSIPGKILIGIPSLAEIFPKFCFDSMFSINELDEFFGYLQRVKNIEPKKIATLSLVTLLGLYLAFLKRPLNKSFYKSVASDFQDFGLAPHSISEKVYESLSWAMFVEESLFSIATLYDPMYQLVDKATNKVGSLCHMIYNYCCSTPAPTPDHDNEANPLIPPNLTETRVSNHKSTLYGTSSRRRTKEEALIPTLPSPHFQ